MFLHAKRNSTAVKSPSVTMKSSIATTQWGLPTSGLMGSTLIPFPSSTEDSSSVNSI